MTDSLKPGDPFRRPAWQQKANCRGLDPDLFFPAQGKYRREVRVVCQGCVVRSECLEYSIDNNEKFGIWGGVPERQRRLMRRKRRAVS